MTRATESVTTTRSDTQTVRIEAHPEQVFDFVSNPENLPRWAVGFCRAIRLSPDDPERWIVSTARGDVSIRFVVDRALGVIDFVFEPARGVQATAFSRVLSNASGCEYVFTQFRGPETSDEEFDALVDTLVEELQVLRGLIHARASCPV
jgi:hypothetical protein